ncbi:hypothetical protein JCM10207_001656 [Rhodosporidiobolus poonsookiae]
MPSPHNLEQQLLSLLANLPEGANPYEAVRDVLWDAVVPEVPDSFKTQLILLIVVLALALALVLGSLVVRLVNRTFWIAHKGSLPPLIRPHFSVSWSLWAVLLLALMEGALVETMGYYGSKTIHPSFMWWQTLVWTPAWFGGFTAAWGILVSFLLHLYSDGYTSQVERWSPYVNEIALGAPIIYTACIFPLAALASTRFSQLMHDIAQIDDLLRQGAASYTGSFSIAQLAPGLPLLQQIETRVAEMQRYFTGLFVSYSVTTFLLTSFLGTVSVLYLRFLHRSLKETPRFASRQSVDAQKRVMRRTYSNLLITLVAFTILGLVFACVSVAIASDPTGFQQSGKSQVFTLIPYYAFAIFGLPTAILLFVRSFERPASSHTPAASRSRTRSRTTSNPIEVAVEVQVVTMLETDPFSQRSSLAPSAQPFSPHSTLAYPHARAALQLPLPEGFVMVETIKEGSPTSSNDDDEKKPLPAPPAAPHPLRLLNPNPPRSPRSPGLWAPSPGFCPESPIIGRWSASMDGMSSPRFAGSNGCPKPPGQRFSVCDSLNSFSTSGASSGSTQAFSIGRTAPLTARASLDTVAEGAVEM